MTPISFRGVCILLFCVLLIPTTTAQPIPPTPESDITTSQTLDFDRIVKILLTIVETIQGGADTLDEQLSTLPKLDIPTVEPFPSDEAFITDDTDESLHSPEPVSPQIIDEIPYKIHVVEPLSGQADAAVIVLHGLGQQVETILPIARALALAGLSNIRFIVPEAPTQYVTFIDTTVPSWFDIASTDPSHPEKRDEILMAAGYIAAIRDLQARDHGIPASRVALLGLSQGGALALTAYMRYQWAGVMGISTWLPLRDSYPEEMSDDSRDANLVMMHGTDDQVILKEWARLSAKLIKQWGRNVSYTELEGEGHMLSGAMPTVITTALASLQEALS